MLDGKCVATLRPFTIHNSRFSIHNSTIAAHLVVASNQLRPSPSTKVQPLSTVAFSLQLVVFALALAMLLRGRTRVLETTLAAAWTWSFAAVTAVGCIEIAVWLATRDQGPLSPLPAWAAAARYAAAVLALCPTIAVLGAKRPQDRAWQWVVLSFWAILLVPAARSYLLLGGEIAVHAAQGTLMLVVASMGAVNWFATRFRWAAIAACAAQLTLIAPYTPLASVALPAFPPNALIPVLLALVARRLQENPARSANSTERLWLDFRDAFGLFWAVRVMARLNAASAQHGWPITVTWRGIEFGDADDRPLAAFARSLRMLLRRFVADDWLPERTQSP